MPKKQHRTLLNPVNIFRLNAHLPVSDAADPGYSGWTDVTVTSMIGRRRQDGVIDAVLSSTPNKTIGKLCRVLDEIQSDAR